jgi:uracil-DNA glycosylase
MQLEEIKLKLFDKLKPSGWDRVFKSFIFSSEFDDILKKLYDLSQDDKRFTPPLKQVFRAFEECPYKDLKVIIIGQDPYPQLGVADGIRYILQEVNRTVYNGHEVSKDVDLSRWSKQGVLMLNTALTVQVGKIGSHYDIWHPFTSYLLDTLNVNNTGLIYVYMGKKAKEWDVLTSDYNHKFFVKHPASAAYSGSKWDSNNLFNEVSDLTNKLNGEPIIW